MNDEQRRRSPMSFRDKFALAEWVRDNTEKILGDRPTWTALGETASKALGFAVSRTAAKEVCEMLGITWEVASTSGRPGSRKAHRLLAEQQREIDLLRATLDDQAARCRRLQADVDTLRGLVRRLYDSLDLKDPSGTLMPPPADRLAVVPNGRPG